MGLRCLLARATPLGLPTSASPDPNTAPSPPAGPPDTRRIWLNGALLQGANPKALLFFSAIVPQFIDASRAVAPQVFLMGVTSISMEFCILLAYGHLAARTVAAFSHPRYATTINRVAGCLLIAAGLGMARLSRS